MAHGKRRHDRYVGDSPKSRKLASIRNRRRLPILGKMLVNGPFHFGNDAVSAKMLGGGQCISHQLLAKREVTAKAVNRRSQCARVRAFDKFRTTFLT
jgi:hypothetical protein